MYKFETVNATTEYYMPSSKFVLFMNSIKTLRKIGLWHLDNLNICLETQGILLII